MIQSKPASTDLAINELIKNRWSPVCLDSDKPVDEQSIRTILEAARWAPSSYNEQPWLYVVGYKGDETYDKLADCLVEGNAWAKQAGVLILSITKSHFDHKHRPNHYCLHDLGAANVLMHLQATELGLAMHQMEGFDFEKARNHFDISDEEYELGSMIAIGHPLEDVNSAPEELRERDKNPRQRKDYQKMLWQNAS